MYRSVIALAFFSTLLFSCTTNKQPEKAEKKKFYLPIVLQDSSQQTGVLNEVKAVHPVSFPYMGKYEFCDTLKLANKLHSGRTVGDAVRDKDIFSEKGYIGIWDSLNTDGFQIFADYKTSIYYQDNPYDKKSIYFPVYIVNETETDKIFFGKDGHAWGVQEAKDTSDYSSWYSIECKVFDFCGNGKFGIKVRPQEFIMILVPKYKGSQTGSMRVRLQVDKAIYVSLPYEGAYHQEQFHFDMSPSNIYQAKSAQSYINFGIYGAAFKRFK